MNYKPYKHLPPFKGMVLQNFPFIEEDFDAITNYQLLCKIVEYLRNVIANELTMEENVTNLYNAYLEIKSFVDNYFANLDVQEEINNKLDEMAENGELTVLIGRYLNPYIQEQNEEIENFKNTVNEVITEQNNKINSYSIGTPLVASSTSDMTDTTKIYVNTSDNKWYYYNGTTWTIGGDYQTTGIANFGVDVNNLSNNLYKIFDFISYNSSLIFDWEQGPISSQGIPVSDTTNVYYYVTIRTSDFLDLEKDFYFLQKLTDFLCYFYLYDVDGNFIAVDLTVGNYDANYNKGLIDIKTSYPTAKKFKVSLRRRNNLAPTFSPSDYDASQLLIVGANNLDTKEDSVYKNKKLSIFGDSISTYAGYIPSGNATYYTGSNAGVTNVNQTWWKKVINALDLDLLINNSWSGRCVSSKRDNWQGHETDAGYKLSNAEVLGNNGTPEVIIIKLGINDFNSNCLLGNYDGSTSLPTDPSYFSNAYAMMLNNIMTLYPLAEVWCCTLMQCERSGELGFPEINSNGDSINDFNNCIKNLAHAFGAKILNHDICGITYYNLNTYMGDYSSSTHQGLHPNANGHSLIANQTIHEMDNFVRARY